MKSPNVMKLPLQDTPVQIDWILIGLAYGLAIEENFEQAEQVLSIAIKNGTETFFEFKLEDEHDV